MLDDTLGIRYEKQTPDEVVAIMAVTEAHVQPFGVLHGGVSVALAESAASVGGLLNCAPGKITVGLEINANHLRQVPPGVLRATARPLHRGRATQVWEVRLEDGSGRLTGVARCTLAVIDHPDGKR